MPATLNPHNLEAAFRRCLARKIDARAHFYAAGWSYRSAAKELGVSYQHLCEVLTGKRSSRRLTDAVLALPHRNL